MIADDDIRCALDAVEKQEMALLAWGVTSGTFTEAELEQTLRSAVPGADVDELIEVLLQRQLLISKGLSEERFRSRMAETVRLATSLRQWFPGRDWRSAPTLVSDSRFLSRSRPIPRRDLKIDDLLGLLRESSTSELVDGAERVLRGLVGNRDLSAFQARSTKRLLERPTGPIGTVVTAGTGAGKTLAFYLPALTKLLAEDRPAGVPRIVAIYPRIELLRDQLRGLVALGRSLGGQGIRAPKIGVLYGASPNGRDDAETFRKWRNTGSGLVSPILSCVVDGCDGAYVWPDDVGSRDHLVCERCADVLSGDELSFVRPNLRSRPPDVLFTTTEMVNRVLGSPRDRRLLVGDASRSPDFVLLDEVHTYSGSHGAQVANLLRRWRAEFANPVHVVGLSATLADPVGFFSELTGLITNVSVVSPEAAEMREVGREYFLALRGDPASQASLLSTTIQTSMLMRRMLDLSPTAPSGGAFGSRLFAFTDDLDVTNRLHSQLEDAEGWQRGGINRKPAGSLAMLRASTNGDLRAREDAGQLWEVAEQIGTLGRAVRVARTTSRDSGVDADADVVVATASLEVGFDDPNVGAVLQHKAPRDAASFMQRRGRAGRDPAMRPWTVVVLSDYGRDRFAFQAYESLFDPVIPPARLPRRNRVILKMQAAWWLTDYLSRFASGNDVSYVLERTWPDRARQREVAEKLLGSCRDLLTETGVARLSNQMRRSLMLDDEDVRSILWDHPRGLLTAVLAVIIRRLEVIVATGQVPSSPTLGEFVPSALFNPLHTPEVDLVPPRQSGEVEREPISQALRQFAPGRVSYRYALGGRQDRVWVEPPASSDPSVDFAAFGLDYIDVAPPPSRPGTRIVQPTRMQLATPSPTTSDSSYGRWNWEFGCSHDGVPLRLDMPTPSSWSTTVFDLSALTHRHRCPQTVWRYANSFEVERNSQSEPPLTRHRLTLNDQPLAVGFASEVDAVTMRLRLANPVPSEEALRAIRVARMEFLVRSSQALCAAIPSSFTRDWLSQVFLSVLVTESGGADLRATLDSLSDDDLRSKVVNAAREVFGAIAIGSDGGNGNPDPGLVGDLADVVQVPSVVPELRGIATALWSREPSDWTQWSHERRLTTLGAAFIDAIQIACPDVDASTLRLDFDVDETSDGSVGMINISEEQPGGVGVVESFVDRYVEDPKAFWSLVNVALGPSDGERVDANLTGYLHTDGTSDLAATAARIRVAPDLASLTSAWREFRMALFELGLDNDQSVVAALSTRVLRPGSSQDLDDLLVDLLDRWRQTEVQLGIEVELRVFARLAANDADVRRRLRAVVGAQSADPGWDISQIVGLLWPRGHRLRSASLRPYSPYRDYEPTERLLFEDHLSATAAVVDGDGADWRDHLDSALRTDGLAVVRAASDRTAAAVVRDLLTEPTSVDVLEFHPRVIGVSRSVGQVDVLVEIREAHQ